MFEYELDGEVLQFTQEDVDNRAKEKGLTTEEYLAQHPEVKPVEMEKTEDVAETSAPAASITPALPQVPFVEAQNTASSSEDISLDSLDPESFLNNSQNLFDTKELEEKDISSYQKALNSFSNALPQLKEAFYGTKGWLIDMAARTAAVPGVSPEMMKEVVYREDIVNNFKKIDDIQQEYEEVGSIIKGIKEGDVGEVAAGVVDGLVSIVTTAIPAMATSGVSLYPQLIAPMYSSYNIEKAKELYGDTPDAIDKLIGNGEDELLVPSVLGGLSAQLERLGIKGISKYIMSMPATAKKKIANLVYTGKTEFLTEYFQGVVEKVSESTAKDLKPSEIAEVVGEYMKSDEAIDAGLKGFVGGTSFASAGSKVRTALRSDSKLMFEVDAGFDEIAKLKNRKDKAGTQEAADQIQLEINDAENRLADKVYEVTSLENYLDKSDRDDLLNNLNNKNDLKNKYDKLKKQRDDGDISQDDFALSASALNNQAQKLDNNISSIRTQARNKISQAKVDEINKKIEELNDPKRQEMSLFEATYRAAFGEFNFETEYKPIKGKATTMTAEQIAESQLETIAMLEAELEEVSRFKDDGKTDQKLVDKLIKSYEQQIDDVKQADLSFGYVKHNKDGSSEIIVNKDKPKFGVAEHEFLHQVLARTLKGDNALQQSLGNAFIQHVNDKGGFNQEYIDRLNAYAESPDYYEEVLTIFSEGTFDGSIKYDENFFTKIGDIVRQSAQRLGIKDIEFNTGRDVYNFIKDYNRSIEKGYDDKAIARLARQGARGKLITKAAPVEGQAETTQKFSKEASDRVQQVYEQQGEAGLFDILEAFKPITTRVARRFRDVPGYDEQLIIDEIETGKRGIFDLIREYKPESGVPLAAYINKFLPARSIEAGNRILKTEFEADVTEARGVAAEETVEQQPERRTRAKVLADELNIADKVASEVAEANVDKTKLKNFKSVPNAATNTVGELLGISPAKIKSKANLTKDEVASAQRWFNKNAQLVIDALPQGFDVEGQATGVPRTVLQALYTQKETRAKTKAGLKGQVKRTNIKDSEFLALVDIIDGKPTRNRNTSARIIALADLLGKTITNQELRKTDPSLARIRSGMSDVMFSKAEGAKAFNMVEKPSDVQIPLVSIQLLKDLLEGKTRTGFRDMDAEFEPGVTFDQKASEIANNFLNQSPEVKSLVENTMTGGVRGGLFLTKPEFNKRIKTKEAKDVSERLNSYRYNYNSEKRLTKKAVEGFNDKDITADRNARLDILHNFWKDVETYLKDNPQDQWFFEALVRDTSRGQQALTRVLAPFRGYAVSENGKPIYNLEVVEEHSMPQNNVSYAYLNAAIEGTVDELKPVIEATYMQVSLLKTDDDAIRESGLEASMPDVYFDVVVPKIKNGELELAPGMAAAVRLAAVGTPYAPKTTDKVIDLNKIYMPELDQTIAQHFGIDKIKDIKAANILLIEELAGINFENTKLPEAQLSKVISNARSVNMYSKASRGMSTFDFDETLIIEGENFIVATKGDDVQRISSGDWPLLGPTLADEGYSFDFTDFVNVRGGVDGPLLQKMKNQIKKYGTQNVFVLTARPAESATAIHEWLKTKGINIPFENITGLGNSSGDAKAAWFLDKYAEGYNDMYFVDDAMPNVDAVKHVFDQLDIKGKSVQAKIKFSKDLSSEFNKMLERTKGVGAEKIFSRIGAQKRGKNVGKFTFFVPPSADDFAGLLRYFVGKGEQGNRDLDFFNKALIKPFARADRDMKEARQSILDDHKTLRKEMPQVVKKLGKMIDDSGFTFDNAIRVYLWDKAGFDIPGLSKRDIAFLTNRVKTDQDLKTYADVVGQISKQKEGYVEPGEYWDTESIAADLQNVVNKQGRKKFLEEWKENVDVIFSPENLNKIEATYGSNFREALENILWRMENGTNRAKGMGRIEGAWNNWVNNSVGAIMFFNARSAVLQTLSTVNFINFEDNNIFAAAKAFANQKQYWKDFSFLFNSDFLKQRRAGLQTNINEAEIANAVAGATNKAKAALQYLLKKGFLPTQIADSFAIASGGATYYRNRIKKYIKQGMSQTEAETQAMEDFMEIAEETQQSARPDRISQQQASSLGRIILAFANTPMQYARLIKKAAGDLRNKRGDWRSHVSRIIYYGAVQSIIFSGLQSAIFALAFDDEKPDEDEIDTKMSRTFHGMLDSLLRGAGLAGAVVSTIKNTVRKFREEDEEPRPEFERVLIEMLQLSPPIGSKSRKVFSALKTYEYNRDVMGEFDTFDLENPLWNVTGNIVSATTNLPLDRAFRKVDNIKEVLNQDNQTWQRVGLALGWDQWSLGIDPYKDIKEAEKKLKEKKKEEKKKNQQRCTKIKSDGTRCKIMVNKPKTRCHYHD